MGASRPPRVGSIRSTLRWPLLLLGIAAAGCSPILTPIPTTPTFPPIQTPSLTAPVLRASALPLQPTQGPTAPPIPTPIVQAPTVGDWTVPAFEVTQPEPFGNVRWSSARTVQIRPTSGSQASGTFSLNVSDQEVTFHPAVSAINRVSGSVEIASPTGAYRLVLKGRQATVFRFSDGGVLARAEAEVVIPSESPSTPTSVAWAPDDSALALLTTSGEVILVSLHDGQMNTVRFPGSGGVTPFDPANWALAWSPGSTRLAIMSLTDQGNCRARVDIVDSHGRPLPSSPLTLNCKSGEFPEWVTDNVLQVTEETSQSFFGLPGGQKIVTRPVDPAVGDRDNAVLISPGQRWMAMKQAVYATSESGPTQVVDHWAYSIVDFSSRDIYPLSDTPGDDIEWVAWKTDASILYLISRPSSAGAAADPRTPFGLLAFDPEHRTMHGELDQAVQVSFDPTQTWAFVVLTDRKTGGLSSALWLPAQNRLSRAKALSSQPVHTASSSRAEGHGQVITPAAWSQDGRQVAYANDAGDLLVTGLAGTTHTIASSLFSDWNDWNHRASLAWSPDDQHLLVNYGGQIWVADLGGGS